jgi:L-threonylcarbamoyladenylate synthase
MLEKAVSALNRGGLVAFPTDTLYALGAHAFMEEAVSRVYEAKGRPQGMALPLLLGSPGEIDRVAVDVPQAAWDLAERFWPGAVTMVLYKAPSVSSTITGGRDTVAVRVPSHPLALALMQGVGAPLTGTSANRSGGPDPVSAEVVRQHLGEAVDVVLDEGPCTLAEASTIVDMTAEPPRIVRAGAVSRAELERFCPGIAEA